VAVRLRLADGLQRMVDAGAPRGIATANESAETGARTWSGAARVHAGFDDRAEVRGGELDALLVEAVDQVSAQEDVHLAEGRQVVRRGEIGRRDVVDPELAAVAVVVRRVRRRG